MRCASATTCSSASAHGRRAGRRPPMPETRGDARLHVVVVGGGFAGVGCVRRLARDDAVRVTLIDRNNYHQFQPLLYQVATSQVASSHIAYSLRKLFRRHPSVDVKMADVAEIDPAART